MSGPRVSKTAMTVDTRDVTFQLRLTEAEHRWLKMIAERRGVSAADVLRMHIRETSNTMRLK
jgi:hypothetical protein